jgi:hypothetical protein
MLRNTALSNEDVIISDYDQDMATYMVERLHLATTQANDFIYEHMNDTSRYYLNVDGNKPRVLQPGGDLKNLYKMLPLS